MNWPWHDQADNALPHWWHWLIALVTLIVLRTFVPLFAAFI